MFDYNNDAPNSLERSAWEIGTGYGKKGWQLPHGAIVGVADLVECFQVQRQYLDDKEEPYEELYANGTGLHVYTDTDEWKWGDYTAGRFAWQLQNAKPLPTPIFCNGRQGLWECGSEIRQAYYAPYVNDKMKEFLREYVKPTPEIHQSLREKLDAYLEAQPMPEVTS
jgi:hypothetical protein